jgi:hypothetical protein
VGGADGVGWGVEGVGDGVFEETFFEAEAGVAGEDFDDVLGFARGEGAEGFGEDGEAGGGVEGMGAGGAESGGETLGGGADGVGLAASGGVLVEGVEDGAERRPNRKRKNASPGSMGERGTYRYGDTPGTYRKRPAPVSG